MTIGSDASSGTLRELLDEVSAERAMEYTRTIAQWQRLSGSEDERKAFDYVEETLRGFGLRTERFAPLCLTSLPGKATLSVLDDDGRQPDVSLPCITHSFSTATGPGGVTGELVYLGEGRPADYAGHDLAGKIALIDGLAGPANAVAAEGTGVVAVVHVNPFELHEMIVSPVWGNPGSDNVDRLPTIPHISVDGETGAMLKQGAARVRITTEVDTGWRPLPVLVATLEPATPSADYVLLSGHIDSWYYGAMDNGTANAAMLETARVLTGHRDLLRRGLRVAFWSGHSHARYGTSAWYADEFWQDLHDHCVAHVNIDSPGGAGATGLGRISGMAETYPAVRELYRSLTGENLPFSRAGRGGDQSFWGVGIPSAAGKAYIQGSWDEGRKDLSGSFGWWWHTADDTMDKIDADNLARDTRVLLASTYLFLASPVLPLAQTAAVEEIRQALGEIAAGAGDAFDLGPVQRAADALMEAAERLTARCGQPVSEAEATRLNAGLLAVSHLLIPVAYTEAGPFGQDPALGAPSLPGLRPAARLGSLPAASAERQLLLTNLRRERNRLLHALVEARRAIEAAVG